MNLGKMTLAYKTLTGVEAGANPPVMQYTKVSITANTDISNTYVAFPWTVEEHDDLGMWAVGAPTRLTIPAGVTKARFTGYAAFTNYSSGTRSIKIVKNGATTIAEVSRAALNESGMMVDSGFITVAESDYFELYISSGSSSYEVSGNAYWGGPAWFQCEVRNNIPIPRTVVGKHAAQTLSGWTNLSFDLIMDDQLGCWSSANPTRMTVPAGYTKCRIFLEVCFQAAGSIYANIQKQGAAYPQVVSMKASETGLYLDTGWMTVSTGDYFVAPVILDGSLTGQAAGKLPTKITMELMP